jgi:hypothetical protein
MLSYAPRDKAISALHHLGNLNEVQATKPNGCAVLRRYLGKEDGKKNYPSVASKPARLELN